jgi:hypothetical protein
MMWRHTSFVLPASHGAAWWQEKLTILSLSSLNRIRMPHDTAADTDRFMHYTVVSWQSDHTGLQDTRQNEVFYITVYRDMQNFYYSPFGPHECIKCKYRWKRTNITCSSPKVISHVSHYYKTSRKMLIFISWFWEPGQLSQCRDDRGFDSR